MTTKSHHSATTSSTTSTTNEDNSNPQQGSTRTKAATNQPAEKRQHRETSKMSFKIPPTQRDGRKLFVGGLPQGKTRRLSVVGCFNVASMCSTAILYYTGTVL